MTDRVDNFNRADSAAALGTPSDGGSAWVATSGGWGISSNQAYQYSSTNHHVAYLEASVADVDVEVTITTRGTDSGLSARVVDDNNHLLVATSGSGVYLYKKVSGSFTLLGSYGTAISDGDTIKLRCSGNDLTVYVNGVSRITATESDHNTATKHGLRNNDNTAARWDNFSITGLGGGGGSSIAAISSNYNRRRA